MLNPASYLTDLADVAMIPRYLWLFLINKGMKEV